MCEGGGAGAGGAGVGGAGTGGAGAGAGGAGSGIGDGGGVERNSATSASNMLIRARSASS